MDNNLSVLLVYQPSGAKPVAVARVDRRSLLLKVAATAIAEAQARAELVKAADLVLGAVEREEAQRIIRVLNLLIPELEASPGANN